MTRAPQSKLAATRWSIRIIPVCIFAAFGVATYVVPARLCSKTNHSCTQRFVATADTCPLQ